MTELQVLDRKRRSVYQIIIIIVIFVIKKFDPNKYIYIFAWVLSFALFAHRQLRTEITLAKEADSRYKCYTKFSLIFLRFRE